MADKKRHIRDHFARQTWFRWALLALIVIAEVLGSWLIMSFVVELSLHAAIPHMSYEWVYIVDSYRLWITLLLGCGAIPLARQVLFRNILTW